MQFYHLLLLLFYLTNTTVFAQEDKPEKILAIKDPKRLVSFFVNKGWENLPTLVDVVEGNRYIFRQKTPTKGYAYITVIIGKMMHHQVYYTKKEDYKKIMDYNEFLIIPEGKSEYCSIVENKMLQFKSINIYNQDDSRNLNMFYGRMNKEKVEQLNIYYHNKYIEYIDSTMNAIEKVLDHETK